MTLFEQAVVFAAQKHSGMKRKLDNAPYILHPMEVALIVSRFTDDEEVLAAAVLHDTVEDTDATVYEIRERFGPRVAELVASETEDKRPGISKSASWRIRKEESLERLMNAGDPAVKYIWLGDKLSNLRGLRRVLKSHGSGAWKLFNQSDPRQHEWYYRSVARIAADLSAHPVWREYSALIDEVFDTVPDVGE